MSYDDYEEDPKEDAKLNAIAGRVLGVYIFLIGLLVYKLFL